MCCLYSVQVGGLLLGGFTSGVGATMPVAITRCRFIDNIPVQPADTLTLQGGGVCIQGPAADSSDDPMSQHGFLQKLDIKMTDTHVEGNVAAEGGGLWTAWPMIIENCTFHNNHAVVSVSGRELAEGFGVSDSLSATVLNKLLRRWYREGIGQKLLLSPSRGLYV
jgi:hypothetical protein